MLDYLASNRFFEHGIIPLHHPMSKRRRSDSSTYSSYQYFSMLALVAHGATMMPSQRRRSVVQKAWALRASTCFWRASSVRMLHSRIGWMVGLSCHHRYNEVQTTRNIAAGLSQVSVEKIAAAMQVSSSNPMVGLEGRASLLSNLSGALKASPDIFGVEGRPGNMLGELPLIDPRPVLKMC
jgi:hypothetical protein